MLIDIDYRPQCRYCVVKVFQCVNGRNELLNVARVAHSKNYPTRVVTYNGCPGFGATAIRLAIAVHGAKIRA